MIIKSLKNDSLVKTKHQLTLLQDNQKLLIKADMIVLPFTTSHNIKTIKNKPSINNRTIDLNRDMVNFQQKIRLSQSLKRDQQIKRYVSSVKIKFRKRDKQLRNKQAKQLSLKNGLQNTSLSSSKKKSYIKQFQEQFQQMIKKKDIIQKSHLQKTNRINSQSIPSSTIQGMAIYENRLINRNRYLKSNKKMNTFQGFWKSQHNNKSKLTRYKTQYDQNFNQDDTFLQINSQLFYLDMPLRTKYWGQDNLILNGPRRPVSTATKKGVKSISITESFKKDNYLTEWKRDQQKFNNGNLQIDNFCIGQYLINKNTTKI